MTLKNMLCALAAMCVVSVSAQNTDDNTVWSNASRGDASAMNQVGVWYYSGNKVERDYDKAFDFWSKAALKGNTKSISNLGVCYQYGRGTKADSVAAMRLYLTAISADQRELYSQRLSNVHKSPFDAMLIGQCYEHGVGGPQDYLKAAQSYALAADAGSVDGMRQAGYAYLRARNGSEAMKYFEQAADRGDIQAKYMAGRMLLGGMGVATDKSRAVKYIKAAAEAGDVQAEALLGKLYLNGDGVSTDVRQAKKWLQSASELGDANAMVDYARILMGEKRYDQALWWLSVAWNAGEHAQIDAFLATLSDQDPFVLYLEGMRYYVLYGDMTSAVECFKQVAKDKVDAGKVMEAVVMADKKNPKGNPSKAAKDLSRLADDNPDAAYYLASMMLIGYGIERDTNKGLMLMRRAANNGIGKAQNALADIYYEGSGTSVDHRGAAELYLRAYKQRQLSTLGAERLRDIYTTGADGVKPDAEKARAMQAYRPIDAIEPFLKYADIR